MKVACVRVWIYIYKSKCAKGPPPSIPLTLLSAFCACGMTMMGSSSSVVSTVSRLPRVKMVERFLKVTLVEKKLAGRVKVGGTASLVPRLLPMQKNVFLHGVRG